MMNKKMMILAAVATAITGLSVSPAMAENGDTPASNAGQSATESMQKKLQDVAQAAVATAKDAGATEAEVAAAVQAAVQAVVEAAAAAGVDVSKLNVTVEVNGITVTIAGGKDGVSVSVTGDGVTLVPDVVVPTPELEPLLPENGDGVDEPDETTRDN